MDSRQAALHIAEIQSRLSSAQTFRGYRSLTVACTGLLALAVAACQPLWVPAPAEAPLVWLAGWLGAAAVSLAGVAVELVLRCRRSGSTWFVRVTLSAVGRFLPCVAAGAALTAVLAIGHPDTLWMLPGLWAILFSLGVLASCAVLPREIAWAGLFYLAAGIGCLVWASGSSAFSPAAMGCTFGGGQLLTAAILYWRLEHSHDGSLQEV